MLSLVLAEAVAKLVENVKGQGQGVGAAVKAASTNCQFTRLRTSWDCVRVSVCVCVCTILEEGRETAVKYLNQLKQLTQQEVFRAWLK